MKFDLALLLAMALAVAVFRACGLGLCGHRSWERVRVSRSLGTKQLVSNWPCSLGLSSCPSRIRLRLNPMVPSEDPKQRPVGTERQPSELPYPLGHFWEYLAQGRRVWLLCNNWDAICLLGVGLLALSLWRSVKRRCRQVSGGDAVCRKGPACGEQTTRTLATKASQERTKPSRHKEALAGPERPSASSPAARLTAAGSPKHGPGPAGAVVRPHDCPEQSYEAGRSRGSRAQQDNSPPREPSAMPFTVLLLFLLPENGPVGLSFRGDRPPWKGRSG